MMHEPQLQLSRSALVTVLDKNTMTVVLICLTIMATASLDYHVGTK